MRTVKPDKITPGTQRKALKKPKKNPPTPFTPLRGTTNAPKPIERVTVWQHAQNEVAKKFKWNLSPEVSVSLLDETPIAVPAPDVKPAHEIMTKVLPEKAFRGSVDRRQAARDKDLRQTHARTTELQKMSGSKTLIARAKREVVQPAKKKAKPRAPRINYQRIGKVALTAFVTPQLRERITRLAEKQKMTTQDFLTHVLDHIATQYEHGSKGNAQLFNSRIVQGRQLEKTVRRVAATLAASIR